MYWRFWVWLLHWQSPSCERIKETAAAAAIAAAALVVVKVRNNRKRASCIRGPFFVGLEKEKLAITASFDYNKLNYNLLDEVTLCI